MIFDLSGSLKVSGTALLAAAQKMILSANPADEFAILSYQGPVYVEQHFTSDAQKLAVALRRAEFGGPSDLFDAVSAAVDYMETNVPKYRRVIVIFSDGEDNYSHVKVGDLLRRLRYPNSPTVYSLSPASDQNVGLGSSSSQRDMGVRNLLELSQATGGLSFVPELSGLLNDQGLEILRDIHSRYSLEYTSTHSQRDGKLHKVEIKVAPEVSASKVKAYFRRGYYAPSH
jgi:VWFA-related protein